MLRKTVVVAALLVVGLHPKLKRKKSGLVKSSTIVVLLAPIVVSDLNRLGLFIKHVSLFHLGEWTFVCKFHRDSLSFDSSLIRPPAVSCSASLSNGPRRITP